MVPATSAKLRPLIEVEAALLPIGLVGWMAWSSTSLGVRESCSKAMRLKAERKEKTGADRDLR